MRGRRLGMIRHTRTMRDSRFDLLRIIAMLAILTCHFTKYMPWRLQEMPGKLGICAILVDKVLGQLGVALFLFLSGWLLCDKVFQPRRVIRIIIETWCCSALVLVLTLTLRSQLSGVFISIAEMLSNGKQYQTILVSLMPLTKGVYWYVNAYVALLLCTPILNRIGQNQRLTRITIAILLVIMNLHLLMPSMRFYNNLTYVIFLYMLGVYLKQTDAREPIGRPVQVFLCLVCISFVVGFIYLCSTENWISSYFGWNDQFLYGLIPWAPAYVAMTLFRWIYRCDALKEALNRYSVLLKSGSTATFGVYLLHQQPLIRSMLFEAVGDFCKMPDNRLHLVVELAFLIFVSYAVLTFVVIVVDKLFFRLLVARMTGFVDEIIRRAMRRTALMNWLE